MILQQPEARVLHSQGEDVRKVAGWNLSSCIFLWAHLAYFGGRRCNLVNPQTCDLSKEESFNRSSCSSFSCQRLIFYRRSPSPVCVLRRASSVCGSTRTRWTGVLNTDSLFEESRWTFSKFYCATLVWHCRSRKKQLVIIPCLETFCSSQPDTSDHSL